MQSCLSCLTHGTNPSTNLHCKDGSINSKCSIFVCRLWEGLQSLEFAVLLMFPSVSVIYIDRLFIFASGCYLHFVAHEAILSKALTLQ